MSYHPPQTDAENSQFLVTAIVSAHNSARFIDGCLSDLLNQTIADRTQIIVIDSGSEQNDGEIVQRFKQHHSNIVYQRTPHETVYQSWNRGVKMARGKYLTNANTDDRRRRDCIETLVDALERNPDIAVAYGDSIVTEIPNQTFDACTPSGYLRWPNFDRMRMLDYCYIGPHPVWRRSLHDELGIFDERYKTAADYEFWLRVAQKHEFIHIPELLGLYWLNENTISRKGRLPLVEAAEIQRKYRARYAAISTTKLGATQPNLVRRCGTYDAKESTVNRASTSQNRECTRVDSSSIKSDHRRILFVVHNFIPEWYGGVELYTYNLARELLAKDWDVSVFYPVGDSGSDNSKVVKSGFDGLTVYKLMVKPSPAIAATIEDKAVEGAFDALLAGEGFDIVHFQHTQRLPFSLIEVAHRRGIPICLTLHDFWFMCPRTHMFIEHSDEVCTGPDTVDKCVRCIARDHWANMNPSQRDRLQYLISFRQERVRELIRMAGIVTHPSEYIAAKYQEYGYCDERALVAPLGIPAIRSADSDRSRVQVTFGYIGAIHPLKNVVMLAETFKRVSGDQRLEIWGNGQDSSVAELKAVIRDDQRIHYHGRYTPEQLGRIFSGIDILVVPSKIESYSLTVREALSAAVPVIASNVGGIPEVVVNGENGILFDPKDPDELLKIMLSVVDNPEIIVQLKMGKSEIKSISEDAREWLDRYKELLGEATSFYPLHYTLEEAIAPVSTNVDSTKCQDNDDANVLGDIISRIKRYASEGRNDLAASIALRERKRHPELDQILRHSGFTIPDENSKINAANKRNPKTSSKSVKDTEVLSEAWDLYHSGWVGEAFKRFEMILDNNPEREFEILAEVYQAFQNLPQKSRYHLYQARLMLFEIKPTDKVLDIGSGNNPFPLATHLGELAIHDSNYGRAGVPFQNYNRLPVIACNIEKLPLPDKSFDFIYCSHVMEHVANPELACKELMRVGRRGYIETPTPGEDLFFNTARISNHRWAVELIDGVLKFREYSESELEGISSNIFMEFHLNPKSDREKAIYALIHLKAVKFNTMLLWDDRFDYEVQRRRKNATNRVVLHIAPGNRKPSQLTELDFIIPPEVRDDELYYLIRKISSEEKLETVLEIGSSSGDGSTKAFVEGLSRNPHHPELYCLELSIPRFEALKNRFEAFPFVKCYHDSTVPLDNFPTEQEVADFYNNTRSCLNQYPLQRILGWLKQDMDYVRDAEVTGSGIERIRRENGISRFDMVLIDGSLFSGKAELELVYGAKIILLDDINGFKNRHNYDRLKADPEYILIRENWNLRNGYAVFRHRRDLLPVHFLTIVLNGEPFIRYHLDVFRKLPFDWHWHIVEGIADLKNDTAWSLQTGGKIVDSLHRNGLSSDGTTEYLDEIAERNPDRITLYRKSGGAFWDGKIEMVNAPLKNIREECLLWQVDVDELWTAEQISSGRDMFIADIDRTAAFYYCHCFVGRDLLITSRDTYGNHSDYEWLRTWRFFPGMQWISHEPPRLCIQADNGSWVDIAAVNPFRHAETEARDLVFQHHSYVLEKQLAFKEFYYGYADAVDCWKKLQAQTSFPVMLRDYFPWVRDEARVEQARSRGVVPIDISVLGPGSPAAVPNSGGDREILSPPEPNQTHEPTSCWCGGKLQDSVHPLYSWCTDCGTFVYRYKPTEPQLKELYEFNYYWHHHQVSKFGFPTIEERASKDFSDRIPYWFELLNKHKPNLKSLLEIGCAHGGFLHYCRQHGVVNVVGVEPAQETCEFAKNNFNLTHVCSGLFPDVSLPLNRFDAIVGFDVLEHFADPLEAIKSVAKLLEQDGICIFQTPCHRGEDSNWVQFKPKEHLFLFNEMGAKLLFTRAGFQDVQISPGYFPDDMFVIARIKRPSVDPSIGIHHQPNPLIHEVDIVADLPGNHVVFLRTDSIGDNVLAMSMLEPLHEHFGEGKFTAICQDRVGDLYESCPFISNVIRFNYERALTDRNYREYIVRKIRSISADVVLNTVYSRDIIVDFLALNSGANRIIGHRGDLCNISGEIRDKADRNYDLLVDSPRVWEHELERHEDFLTALGINAANLQPQIWLTDEDHALAVELLKINSVCLSNFAVLFAGSKSPHKKSYILGPALSQFSKLHNTSIVALGTENEFAENQENLKLFQNHTVNLCGKMPLRVSAAILKRSRIAIGADTGLAHVAWSVNTPCVILMGGGHFGRFLPRGKNSSTVCLPLDCYGCNWQCKFDRTYCTQDITAQTLKIAIGDAMGTPSDKPRIYVQSTDGSHNGCTALADIGKFVNVDEYEIIRVGSATSGSQVSAARKQLTVNLHPLT